MLGKILGLSAVGLLQVIIWLAVVFGVLATQGTLAGIHLEKVGRSRNVMDAFEAASAAEDKTTGSKEDNGG
jgi:ABC-type Na+ efflux pump permease subunit